MVKGIGASAGIGLGTALLVTEQPVTYTPHTPEDPAAEQQRFDAAFEAFCTRTQSMAENMDQRSDTAQGDILRGHILMLQDPFMQQQIADSIQGGSCAEAALEAACDMFITVFSASDDELTRQRAADVRDIKTRMLKILLHIEDMDLSQLPVDTVLIADELTPSMTAGMQAEHVSGIVTQKGGKTSHSAILARALGIPAVLGVSDALQQAANGDLIGVDGGSGFVYFRPDGQQQVKLTQQRQVYLQRLHRLEQYRGKTTVTADGRQIELVANIGNPKDLEQVLANDAEGIGLFRTEFLFMDRDSMPSQEEQFSAYKQVAAAMHGKPVIIRTLDVGGDKDIPYLGMQREENPFLGCRAVRYCLQHPQDYEAQLRALVRAAAYGDIRIMVPLVTGLQELRQVKEMVRRLEQDCAQQDIPHGEHVPVGVMIETPAACMIADLLAKEADFFSIGTNDLTQYILAADRGNPQVEYLYSVYHPAVLRAIQHVIACAKQQNIPVGMCGESAADPALAPLLISFGLDEYSVTPRSVLEVRANLAQWTQGEADAVAAHVMALDTETAVQAYLQDCVKA